MSTRTATPTSSYQPTRCLAHKNLRRVRPASSRVALGPFGLSPQSSLPPAPATPTFRPFTSPRVRSRVHHLSPCSGPGSPASCERPIARTPRCLLSKFFITSLPTQHGRCPPPSLRLLFGATTNSPPHVTFMPSPALQGLYLKPVVRASPPFLIPKVRKHSDVFLLLSPEFSTPAARMCTLSIS